MEWCGCLTVLDCVTIEERGKSGTLQEEEGEEIVRESVCKCVCVGSETIM